jgi:multimeric flavodoxin WrbA
MKVAAFNGSPKRDGNTARLLGYALAELEAAGVETELVQVGGMPLRGCLACGKCFEQQDRRCVNDKDAMNGFIETMIGADGILLGSPTYFADVTSETKALIDRAGYVTRANGGLLRRKVGAGVVVNRRAGAIHAFDTLNHFFLIAEMVVVGSSYWNIGIGLAPGDVDADAEGVETMRTLGRNMAWALERLAGPERT